MGKKILYSPCYGGGWLIGAGYKTKEVRNAILTWPALIQAVENGEAVTNNHPAFKSLVEYCQKIEPDFHIFLDDLEVATVYSPFRIDEYDGSEYIVEMNAENYIDPEDL